MENIVLNKVPSNTASARNIVLDKMPTPPFTAAVTAKYYWRFDDEPTSNFLYLGQQAVGAALAVPFEGSGRDIRISMIGVAANGVQSTYDPREGVQTTIALPSVIDTVVTHEGEIVTHLGEIVTHSS